MRTAPFRHVHNTRANAASNMPASSHRHFGGWAKLNVVPHRLSELLTKITDLGSFPLQYRFIAHPSLLPRIIPYPYLPLARNSTPMFSNADVTTSAFKRCASKQLLAYGVERIRSG
jgi:hypothetical protein